MIYLASPYSHIMPEVVNYRVRAVMRTTARMLSAGLMVYSPIVHCHHMSVQELLPTDFEFWKKYNEHMLLLSEQVVILMLAGWEESKGVKQEQEIAELADIPVLYLEYEE